MRQFIAQTHLDSKGCLLVENKKAHYLINVLRLCPGDMLYVRLPDGTLQNMTVAKIEGEKASEKKRVILQVAGERNDTASSIKALPIQNKNELDLWLFQFVAKPAKMELIVRQACECGVSNIVFVEGKFCQKGNIDSARKKCLQNDERFSRIICEAKEQCGSAVDTKILGLYSLSDAISLWKEHNSNGKNLSFVLYEQTLGTKSIFEAAGSSLEEKINCASLVVGAEGGISPEEIELLKNEGFIPVHFNTNILRCETASVYGIAAIQTVLLERELWQFKE